MHKHLSSAKGMGFIYKLSVSRNNYVTVNTELKNKTCGGGD